MVKVLKWYPGSLGKMAPSLLSSLNITNGGLKWHWRVTVCSKGTTGLGQADKEGLSYSPRREGDTGFERKIGMIPSPHCPQGCFPFNSSNSPPLKCIALMLRDTWGLGTDRDTVNPGRTSWGSKNMILGSDSLGWQNVEKLSLKTQNTGDSLLVQLLGLSTFSSKGPSWIPDQGTKILQAAQCRQKKTSAKNWCMDKKGKGFPVAFIVAQIVKNLPVRQESRVQSLSWQDLLVKEMATHSCILAWRIPWIEEPGELQSLGLQTVRLDRATNANTTKQWKSHLPEKKEVNLEPRSFVS